MRVSGPESPAWVYGSPVAETEWSSPLLQSSAASLSQSSLMKLHLKNDRKKAAENLQHEHLWCPGLSRRNLFESWKINISKGKCCINAAKTINFKSTSVTSCVRRAFVVLVEVALTLIVVQLCSNCAQLLTQIIDLFHKNYVVLNTDGRCTQTEIVTEGKWKVTHSYCTQAVFTWSKNTVIFWNMFTILIYF